MALPERRIEEWVQAATDALDRRYLTGREPPEFISTTDYAKGLDIIYHAANAAALEPDELVTLQNLDKASAMLGALGSVLA